MALLFFLGLTGLFLGYCSLLNEIPNRKIIIVRKKEYIPVILESEKNKKDSKSENYIIKGIKVV